MLAGFSLCKVDSELNRFKPSDLLLFEWNIYIERGRGIWRRIKRIFPLEWLPSKQECVFIVVSSLWVHSPNESCFKICNKILRETRVFKSLYNKDNFENLPVIWVLRNFSDILFLEHLLAIRTVRKFKGLSWESSVSLSEVYFSY